MRAVSLAVFGLAIVASPLKSGAQSSTAPSYLDPDYRPAAPATLEDVVGHYAHSGDLPVQVWFAADGTARIVFSSPPEPEVRLGSLHEYAGTWKIRNGWVDLSFDFGQVVFEFAPGSSPDSQPTLTAKHALHSSLLLRFGTLSRVEAD
jgi:hypothetical protein